MLSPRLTSSGLLLVFVAGVICLCGLLGYQNTPIFGGSESPKLHLSEAPAGFADNLPQDHGPAGAFYTAVLFAVSLGAALGLLFGAAGRWAGVGTVLTVRRFPPPSVLPPPRIPARSQLQVFLL